MSYRGRVIQRGPVACYAKPMSIQEQQQKTKELIRLFNVPIYRSYTGQVKVALEQFQKLGIVGEFPYPSILPSDVSAFLEASDPIWMQLPGNFTFTASCSKSVPPSTSSVRRVVLVVNVDGASPTIHAKSWLPTINPGTTSTNQENVNESICMVNPTRYVLSSITGGNSSDVNQFIDLPSPTAQVFVALACTQELHDASAANAYMTYTTSIGPEYFFKTQFS